jgi:hypothetical protein
MDFKYEVSQLFQAAFGINSPIYIAPDIFGQYEEAAMQGLGFGNKAIDYSGLEVMRDYTSLGNDADFYNERGAKSWMGTPIVFQAKFAGGKYQVYKNGFANYEAFEGIDFPPATMFSFRRAKNIIRTNVIGDDGTVKEIFGFDDWVIDVRGLCLDEPNRSARRQLLDLLNFERIADAIKVEGSQFNVRKIQAVTMEDWSDNVPQGKPGVIAFQCKLISDKPIELNTRI